MTKAAHREGFDAGRLAQDEFENIPWDEVSGKNPHIPGSDSFWQWHAGFVCGFKADELRQAERDRDTALMRWAFEHKRADRLQSENHRLHQYLQIVSQALNAGPEHVASQYPRLKTLMNAYTE